MGVQILASVVYICIQAASSSISVEARMECDSHADTSVVGKNSLMFHDYGRPVRVSGYHPRDGVKECRTVSAAVAYDHPQTGQVYILIINQAIEIPHLENHLLCPMQCRVNGVRVNDVPNILVDNPDTTTHASGVPDPIDKSNMLYLPLSSSGVTSYFHCRKPTTAEFDNEESHPRIKLTAEEPLWDPGSDNYSSSEDCMVDLMERVVCRERF